MGVVSEKQGDNDKVYEFEGAKVIVADVLEGAMKGMTINYTSLWFRKGFEIIPEFN